MGNGFPKSCQKWWHCIGPGVASVLVSSPPFASAALAFRSGSAEKGRVGQRRWRVARLPARRAPASPQPRRRIERGRKKEGGRSAARGGAGRCWACCEVQAESPHSNRIPIPSSPIPDSRRAAAVGPGPPIPDSLLPRCRSRQ